jgi:iron complex outermembrane receptor protein
MGHRLHPLSTAVAVACAMTATWHHAGAESATELSEIVVSAETPGSFPSSSVVTGRALEAARVGTSDTAKLLLQVPGVSLYGAGGVSSLPAIHGLADDRVRVKVDGMDLIASCPNHMNPPLSYLDPTAVGSLKVYAGIVPVSLAGRQHRRHHHRGLARAGIRRPRSKISAQGYGRRLLPEQRQRLQRQYRGQRGHR